MVEENNVALEHFFDKAKKTLFGGLQRGKAKAALPLQLGNMEVSKFKRLVLPLFRAQEQMGRCVIKETDQKYSIQNMGYAGYNRIFGKDYCIKKVKKNEELSVVGGHISLMKKSGNFLCRAEIASCIRNDKGEWIIIRAPVAVKDAQEVDTAEDTQEVDKDEDGNNNSNSNSNE